MSGFTWMASFDEGWLVLLGEASARAVVVLGAAWVACFLLRKRSAALRHLIWAFSLAALAASPVSFDFAPKLRIPAGWPGGGSSTVAAASEPAVVGDAARPRAVRRQDLAERRDTAGVMGLDGSRAPAFSISVATVSTGPGSEINNGEHVSTGVAAQRQASLPAALLFAIWAVGFCVLAARLIVGHLRLRRMARAARVIDVSDDLSGLEAGRDVRFLQSARETMPMTWGWRRPVVLLPASFGNWRGERRAMTIYHELAHVRRADWFTQTLAQVVRAVYWFHPLVWFALRRMRVEADRACDDMVLGQGIKASGYAGHLVSVAREFRTAGLRPWVAIAMAHPSSLDQRVQYVLDATVRRAGLGRRALFGVALSVAAVVLAVPSLDAGGQAVAAPQQERAIHEVASALRADVAARVQKARAIEDLDSEAAGRLSEEAVAELSLLAQAQETAPAPNPRIEDQIEFEMRGRDIEQHMERAKSDLARISKRMAWAQHNAPHKIWANMEGGEPRLSPEALQTASAALRKALGSTNASVRAQAAESLGQLGSREAVNLEALGKAVSDSEPQVQKAAAEALGQVLSQDHDIPGEVAVDYLKPALASPNVEVRREAAGALQGLRGPAAISAAVQMAD
ncbi:MAG: M56 family metallopeptidase, partial [Bryobacterales bacterium]